jgi:hypothetical protein
MKRKLSMFKFFRNIAEMGVISALFFGLIGFFVSSTMGLIDMGIMGLVIGAACCFAMELSIILEVRVWESSIKEDPNLNLEEGLWFMQKKIQDKRKPKSLTQ